MLAVVIAEGVAVVLLAVLVLGLLRSHALILKALHELGAGLELEKDATPDGGSHPGPVHVDLESGVVANARRPDSRAAEIVGTSLDRQERTIEVFAHEPWNETGLYLEPGEYRFIADGMWQDGDILSGPEGTQGMRGLNPMRERLRMLGSLLGGGERLLRMLTGNELASLVGTRRESDLPWMFLVGVTVFRAS